MFTNFLVVGLILLLAVVALLLAMVLRYLFNRMHFQSDLLTLNKWVQVGNIEQIKMLLTNEGRCLADNFYQRLHSSENRILSLEKESLTDDLTKLLNRRGMKRILNFEYHRMQREYSNCYTILLFDIDNFKLVNDRYGHLTGDEVLKQISRLATKVLRRCDSCSRWGGEEFLILLPNTDNKEATFVARKLLDLVANHKFHSACHDIKITITAGLATGGKEHTIDEIIHQADLCLYEGKRKGRNRIITGQKNKFNLPIRKLASQMDINPAIKHSFNHQPTA